MKLKIIKEAEGQARKYLKYMLLTQYCMLLIFMTDNLWVAL